MALFDNGLTGCAKKEAVLGLPYTSLPQHHLNMRGYFRAWGTRGLTAVVIVMVTAQKYYRKSLFYASI